MVLAMLNVVGKSLWSRSGIMFILVCQNAPKIYESESDNFTETIPSQLDCFHNVLKLCII
jgi:hypothetical protein